ncbi:hypothetical protein CPLU01_06752 [Colletotrichum plurivorum]|uniref:Uncharacterized protein n=1 Tax=Colletotrichum plurivorum TaxID=2175906 RepID=A0A8H6NFB7_9PEZI|nr:hypothetical protein CPLU01_06752 [Colletotrichum plurivorum]
MAGPLQVGDIVNISKLAWDVYRFGWDKDFNAARQYAEFGRDVRGLAENLDTLGLVVIQADKSLRSEGAFSRAPRWDPSSLGEIIGDYESTLQECVELIKNNNRYRLGGGPLRNIEWNVLVAPSADRLRARIALHNSKVLHVLKPFEIDLLCRVREDIHMVHRDLAQRIQAVHGDLHRLMGVLVPDLEKELEQQARRELHTLDMPPMVKQGLQKAWMNRSTDDLGPPSLQDMTDAFVTHFNKSTVTFSPLGILVENRIPPLEMYVNLLKCIWIKEQILESPQLRQITPGVSHWPSFIQELEDTLSTQCGRFRQDLVQPSIVNLTQEMLDIWPEKPLPQLVDVVTKSALMEQVLDVQLQGPAATVQKKLQLLRRMGADGKRFRINISGVEQGTSRSQGGRDSETIDFDISTVILNPLYAMPSKSGALDMILRKDERIANLPFTSFKDVVKFQQAVTGFKAFDRYCQYNAMVSFVVSGRDEPLVEDACVQLWVPKQLDGQLVTDNEAQASGNAKNRTLSTSTSAYDTTSRQGSVGSILSSPEHFTRSPTETISMWDNISPLGASASRGPRIPSPPALNAMNPLASRSPISIARRPVGSGSSQSTLPSPPGGSRQTTLTTPPSSPPSSSLFPGWPSAARAPSISTVNSRPDRTFSVSSAVSTTTPPSNDSSGNASEAHTVTVSIGGHTTGTVHRRPPQPMIVLFTQNRATRRMALVTVDIDEETAVNPDRCNCRRSGSDGASCAIAAVEQKSGKLELSARRFESRDGDTDWNIAKLALERQREKEYGAAYWKNVRRISIMFPTAEGRAKFGGTPNKCQCKARTEGEHFNCLKTGHKGHLGLVQEYARQQLNEYYQARYVSQQDVVRGMRDDYR